jgi:hypothetical protein
MRVLKDNDFKTFEQLCALTQKGMKKTMAAFLRSKYKQVIETQDYIVAIGDIPIALVAHMDTVYKTPVKNLYYDTKKGVMWSPEGLGADDRAGVFAILKIIQSGLRPSVIFTTDEEKGGLGAAVLAEEDCPIPNVKYLIQLDRRGVNDCVFYDCYNPEFTAYVESFGFMERWGSFSDISFLCPEWNVCGVNLSVGYEDEHSVAETLYVPALFETIEKVKKMLTAGDIPTYEYKELAPGYSRWFHSHPTEYDSLWDMDYIMRCDKCHHTFSEYELIPAKGANGKTKHFCTDCIVGNVDWCDRCGEPYEVTAKSQRALCEDCAKVKVKTK